MKIAFYHYFWPHILQKESKEFENKISEYLVIYNLAKSLEKKGHEIIRYSKTPPQKYLPDKNVKIFRNGLMQPVDLFKFFVWPPDILGIVSKSIYNSKKLMPLIRLICRIRKVKFLIFMGHDESETSMKILKDVKPYKYYEKNFWDDKKDYHKRLEINKLYRPKSKNEFVIVPSKIIKSNCIKEGWSENNIYVLPHGTDTDHFHPPIKKSDHPDIKILFAGNGATRKGLPYLIKAIEILKNKFNIKLTVLSHNIKNIEVSNIKLYEDIDDNKLLKLYQTHDIFVLPSLLDGWGLTASEAMACGMPVVVSGLTGIKDIINNGENGFIVKNKDHSELVVILDRLINNPELRKTVGLNARKMAVKYSWDHITKIFQDLMNQKK